jgi:hypothetical protein
LRHAIHLALAATLSKQLGEGVYFSLFDGRLATAARKAGLRILK